MAELPWLHAAAHAPPFPPSRIMHMHACGSRLLTSAARASAYASGGAPVTDPSRVYRHILARACRNSPRWHWRNQQNTGVGLKTDDRRAPLKHAQGSRRAGRRELEAQVGRRAPRRTEPLPAALRLRSLACALPRQRKIPRPKPALARSSATSSSLNSPRLGASAVALATA